MISSKKRECKLGLELREMHICILYSYLVMRNAHIQLMFKSDMGLCQFYYMESVVRKSVYRVEAAIFGSPNPAKAAPTLEVVIVNLTTFR